MARPGREGDGESSVQASLGTVLAAIKDIQRNHDSTVSALEKSFDDKLDGLRREMTNSQEKACGKLTQKLKEKEKFQFRRKGNEVQHTFNEELKEKIDGALPLLENPESVERAKQLLKKGSVMIAERQKLIKIADRSDQGWKTADEYERDPVASDSDDEKRIRKAETAAEKKASRERLKRQGKSRGGFRSFRHLSQREQWRQSLQAPFAVLGPGQQTKMLPYSRRREPCFRCGSESHWVRDCPMPRVGAASGTIPSGQPSSAFAGRRQ